MIEYLINNTNIANIYIADDFDVNIDVVVNYIDFILVLFGVYIYCQFTNVKIADFTIFLNIVLFNYTCTSLYNQVYIGICVI